MSGPEISGRFCRGPGVTDSGFRRVRSQFGARGVTRHVDALVLRDLYSPLTDRGIAFVDLNKQVVAASKREQQLYDEGRSETPVSYTPLEPAYEIAGDGTQLPDGRVTMTLSLKNLVTGKVMATKTVTGMFFANGLLVDGWS